MLQHLSSDCIASFHLCKADKERKLTTSVFPLAEVTNLSSAVLSSKQEGVCPQLHSVRRREEVQGGATATSWHCLPWQAYLLMARLRTLFLKSFLVYLFSGPSSAPRTCTHMHTCTHKRTQWPTLLSREGWKDRLPGQQPTDVWHSTGGLSDIAEHLTSQILTSASSSSLCGTWPPVDTAPSSLKKVREVKSPFSSASFCNLTVASKASYSPSLNS